MADFDDKSEFQFRWRRVVDVCVYEIQGEVDAMSVSPPGFASSSEYLDAPSNHFSSPASDKKPVVEHPAAETIYRVLKIRKYLTQTGQFRDAL